MQGLTVWKLPRSRFAKITSTTIKLMKIDDFERISTETHGEDEDIENKKAEALMNSCEWVLTWTSKAKTMGNACIVLAPRSVRVEEGMVRGSFVKRKGEIEKLGIKNPEEMALSIKSVDEGEQRTLELLTNNDKDKTTLVKIVRMIMDGKVPADILADK